MWSLGSLAASGLSNLPDNPTTDHPFRRVGTEHRRVLVGNLTATNPLLMPDTLVIVGFVGFSRGMGAINRKWRWG
jgi:hypothetical protein